MVSLGGVDNIVFTAGVGENNVYKISRYAEERYKLRNDYDEAYTEYRTLKWGGD